MSDRPKRARRVFIRALGLHGAEREVFLSEACGDLDLRRDVDSLFSHLDADPAFLERPGAPRRIPLPIAGDLLGDFRIVREIGKGGMGVVYEAVERSLDRRVALKVLRESLATSRDAHSGFRREATLAARLRHRNIVPVYRLDEHAGLLFIVSELITGPPLHRWLARRPGPLPEKEALEIVAAVAEALDYAHQHGIIHRDVKPANVLLDEDGTPRLTDFGQAKDVLDDASVSGTLTGTFHYMSPEQANLASAQLDKRTDVFSLGVVLYEMLTGRKPFLGETPVQVMDAIRSTEPPVASKAAPGVSEDAAVVCRKALEKERLHRYQSAGALAADLRATIAGEPILARPPGLKRRARQFIRRHRSASAAVLALLIGVPTGVGVIRYLDDPSPRLTVITEPAGAVLTARRIDPRDGSFGPPVRFGRSPASDRLPAGYYRITAVLEGTGSAEATRHLPADSTVEVHARIRPTDEVTRPMVLVSLDDPELLDRVRAKFSGAAPPASFWIDRTEVSNGDFRRYLEETGSSYRPGLWGPVEEWDPAWDALPVAGVPYREAQSYAEWAGKRLPTLAEWDLAARGPDAAMYPWGDDETLTPEALIPWANVFGDDHAWIWSPADSFPSLAPRYRERVLPVNVLPDGYRDVSWIGLVHTLGNVAEWTESVPFIQGAGDFRERIVKGDHWGRDLDETWSLRKRMTHFIESGPMLACGIRCAKTVGLEVPESAGTESPTGRR